MIKYRVRLSSIQPCEVLRETEKQVVLPVIGGGERRENKFTGWHKYFDSWEEAHAHLVAKVQCEVDVLRSNLERANGKLGQIKGMKPPPTPAPRERE